MKNVRGETSATLLISSTVTPSSPRSASSSRTATWIARRVARRLRSRSPGSAVSVVTELFLHSLQNQQLGSVAGTVPFVKYSSTARSTQPFDLLYAVWPSPL